MESLTFVYSLVLKRPMTFSCRSHMITFLNDKQDWQLRGAFFNSIVGVAAYVGWHSYAQTSPRTGHLIMEDLNFAMKFQH